MKPQSPFAVMSSRASSSVVVELLKALALQRLKFRLNLNVMAHLVHDVAECVSNFIVSSVCVTALAQCNTCVKLKLAPHAHVSGILVGSHP